MPQHVRMNLEGELRSLARSLDHPQEPRWRYWRSYFSDEHIRTAAL
jgi:hypothetical protein